MGQENSNGVQGELETGVTISLHETTARSIRQKVSRGKSGREKDEIIRQLKVYIQSLKSQLKSSRARFREKKKESKAKLTKEEVRNITSEIRREKNNKLINKYSHIRRKHAKIIELKSEVESLNKQLVLTERNLQREAERADKLKQSYYKACARKRRKKLVYKDAYVSKEVERFKKIIDGGIDTASFNVYANLTRCIWFSKEKNIHIELLCIMEQIFQEESVTYRNMRVGSRSILNRGISEQLISEQNIGATKYYFLTVKGKEFIMEFKKYVKRRSDLK